MAQLINIPADLYTVACLIVESADNYAEKSRDKDRDDLTDRWMNLGFAIDGYKAAIAILEVCNPEELPSYIDILAGLEEEYSAMEQEWLNDKDEEEEST